MTPVEESYASHHASTLALLKQIQSKVEDLPAPDGDTPINWGHVGSMYEVEYKLSLILEFLK